MNFQISRQARQTYQLESNLFAYSGGVILADLTAARNFAFRINQRRDLARHPEKTLQAGHLYSMGLMEEIFHHVVEIYRQTVNPQIHQQLEAYLLSTVGSVALESSLAAFLEEFPPTQIAQNHQTIAEYLAGVSEGLTNRQIAIQEMLMLWLANKNPALEIYRDFMADDGLMSESAYPSIIKAAADFFQLQPPFGAQNQNLVEMLRSPAIIIPHSLPGQLEYIRTHWGDLLGAFLQRLLVSLDVLREEQKTRGLGGPGPIPIPVYDARMAGTLEAEQFSQDSDWMPRLVLLAKNTYVWLDQLSRAYGRKISRLDEIPDEELQTIRQNGFTGLWLIGLWERSRASAQIKQLCGNPEAISSAYSLFNYEIAAELGGEQAYQALREKAWKSGIRLASDMVPNHMGIDSPWVVENPDWFISLSSSPFPSYTFNGPDLSADARVRIYLEDHYYTRSDAAVVFKRVDAASGRADYVYHGNDGTSMPWNDTAQLNYLNPRVREAVIQTILAVARRFPIIRFDAAMTLARTHFQRLWFPEPGTGGDIPSRAEHALSQEEFNRLMPAEFWREVVDRVAIEAPDTLLLAEAFWLMEGYFVRTLGMHRVYNSAFMNMLRDENNAGFQSLLQNTIEFDPQILKRFVNFMNNPDERTAIDQFGRGDKFFAVSTLLATLPGLPMFGHGQVEGFSEKYGMEFHRAYWDETPDADLVARHRSQIAPLLQKRSLFADVENFWMFEFSAPSGESIPSVYAYTNEKDGSHVLVMVNNSYTTVHGALYQSTLQMRKDMAGQRFKTSQSLADALRLPDDPNIFLIYRDQITNLEYIRSAGDLAHHGWSASLGGYEHHVFMDFRQVREDAAHPWRRLADYLAGRGIPSIEQGLLELQYQPVLDPWRALLSPAHLNYILRTLNQSSRVSTTLLHGEEALFSMLLDGIAALRGPLPHRIQALASFKHNVRSLIRLKNAPALFVQFLDKPVAEDLPALAPSSDVDLLVAWLWSLVSALGPLDPNKDAGSLFASLHLQPPLEESIMRLLTIPDELPHVLRDLRLLLALERYLPLQANVGAGTLLESLLSDSYIQEYLGIHRYNDVLWYNREACREFLTWLNRIEWLKSPSGSMAALLERVALSQPILDCLARSAGESEFQVEKWLEKCLQYQSAESE